MDRDREREVIRPQQSTPTGEGNRLDDVSSSSGAERTDFVARSGEGNRTDYGTSGTGPDRSEYAMPTGGGVPVRRETDRDVVQQTQIVAPRDRVRWGPIWAGLLTALGTFLLLSLLATAIGAQTFNTGAANTTQTGIGTAVATAIIGLLSFLLGGFVAARSAAVRGRLNGLLNGWLVWALGTLLILGLAAFGLGQLFGLADDVIGRTGIPNPNQANVNPRDVASNVRNSALGGFLSLALPALASSIGGLLGARTGRDTDVDAIREAANRYEHS